MQASAQTNEKNAGIFVKIPAFYFTKSKYIAELSFSCRMHKSIVAQKHPVIIAQCQAGKSQQHTVDAID